MTILAKKAGELKDWPDAYSAECEKALLKVHADPKKAENELDRNLKKVFKGYQFAEYPISSLKKTKTEPQLTWNLNPTFGQTYLTRKEFFEDGVPDHVQLLIRPSRKSGVAEAAPVAEASRFMTADEFLEETEQVVPEKKEKKEKKSKDSVEKKEKENVEKREKDKGEKREEGSAKKDKEGNEKKEKEGSEKKEKKKKNKKEKSKKQKKNKTKKSDANDDEASGASSDAEVDTKRRRSDESDRSARHKKKKKADAGDADADDQHDVGKKRHKKKKTADNEPEPETKKQKKKKRKERKKNGESVDADAQDDHEGDDGSPLLDEPQTPIKEQPVDEPPIVHPVSGLANIGTWEDPMSDMNNDGDTTARRSPGAAENDVVDRGPRSRDRDGSERRERYDKRHPGKGEDRFPRDVVRGRSRSPPRPSRSPETPPSDPRLKRYRSGPRTPSRSPPPNSGYS